MVIYGISADGSGNKKLIDAAKNSLFKLERKDNFENSNPPIQKIGDDHEFTGRYGGARSITFENGIFYIQRDGGNEEFVKKDQGNH